MSQLDGGLARRAFETIVDLRAAEEAADLEGIMRPVLQELGIPYFAAARFFRADRTADTRVLLGSFHPQWAQRYVRAGYGRDSCLVREMIQTSRPYSWNETIPRIGFTDAGKDIWNEARDFGLTDGLFVPFRDFDGSYCAVALAGPQVDWSDPLLRAITEVLAAHYASEGKRLWGSPGGKAVSLSPRQQECLKWVREGKSSAEIATILGLSAPTVDEHISQACRKLGVRTRVQAVIEAHARLLIHP